MEHHQDFGKIRVELIKQILMVGFSGIVSRRSKDDKRQIKRWKKIASRFRVKLVKMIRDAGSRFDDYSISLKIRQILLHWGYELTEKIFFNELSN